MIKPMLAIMLAIVVAVVNAVAFMVFLRTLRRIQDKLGPGARPESHRIPFLR